MTVLLKLRNRHGSHELHKAVTYKASNQQACLQGLLNAGCGRDAAGETIDNYYQPLERAEIVRLGKDVTIFCYSRMRYVVMQAVATLEKQGYDPEVHSLALPQTSFQPPSPALKSPQHCVPEVPPRNLNPSFSQHYPCRKNHL